MEVLIVIGLVGVLLALLLMASQRASSSANQTRCAARMRQVTATILLYSTENNGKLLPWLFNNRPPGENAGGKTWCRELISNDYFPGITLATTDAKGTVLACPARPKNTPSDPSQNRLHYGYNHYPGFDSRVETLGSYKFSRLGEIERPAKTMCLGETRHTFYIRPWEVLNNQYPHSEGMNVTYFDGHARWFKGPLPLIKVKATTNTEPYY